MNRSIALFVALAVLLAHALAIRTDAAGELAPPYDQAFAAYRLASRWVLDGKLSWNVGQGGFESYPSMLWVAVCAVGERLYLPINVFVRVIGMFATAVSVILASRFHADRAASLITPMLLAISGVMAAAAVSGTETALLTMLLTFAFLAFERGWSGMTGAAMLLCGLTRSEAWVLIPVFLLLRYRARRRAVQGVVGPPAAPLWIFAPPLLGMLVMAGMRWSAYGRIEPAWVSDLAQLDGARLWNGLAYVRDFLVSAASPLLLVYSLWYALRRELSHTGAHALAVVFAWSTMIVLQGGGATPFAESLVPVLPVALISAQEAMITALNSLKRAVRTFAWLSFIGAVIISTLSSLPTMQEGDSALATIQNAWTRPAAAPRYGFDGALGRPGLDEDMSTTLTLRGAGLFLRDHVDPARSVLTPWPSSIAYLSHLEVRDLLGHATAAAPYKRPRPNAVNPRVDVLAAIEAEPDYIVAYLRRPPNSASLEQLAREWWVKLDFEPEDPAREALIEASLQRYELITIPLPSQSGRFEKSANLPILRHKRLGMTPRLTAEMHAGKLRVQLEHSGHLQLADLAIFGTNEAGKTLSVTPTGRIVDSEWSRARANLLISENGERRVTLFDMPLDQRTLELEELHVVLLNPGAATGSSNGRISEELVLSTR